MKQILSKFLRKAYEMGLRREAFSTMQSEFDLPYIEYNLLPELIRELEEENANQGKERGEEIPPSR